MGAKNERKLSLRVYRGQSVKNHVGLVRIDQLVTLIDNRLDDPFNISENEIVMITEQSHPSNKTGIERLSERP